MHRVLSGGVLGGRGGSGACNAMYPQAGCPVAVALCWSSDCRYDASSLIRSRRIGCKAWHGPKTRTLTVVPAIVTMTSSRETTFDVSAMYPAMVVCTVKGSRVGNGVSCRWAGSSRCLRLESAGGGGDGGGVAGAEGQSYISAAVTHLGSPPSPSSVISVKTQRDFNPLLRVT